MTLADYLPRLRRRRPRPQPAPPIDAGTYVRHGIVVPRLPDHTDGDCYGWPPGYIDAHREADRISAARAHDARVRAQHGERELLDELYLGEQTRVRHETGRLRMATHLVRARADYEVAAAETERATQPAPPETPEPAPEPEPEPEAPTDLHDGLETGPIEIPDYRDVPWDELTKPQAQAEARRLTALGYRVVQNKRTVEQLRDDVRDARTAAGERRADA